MLETKKPIYKVALIGVFGALVFVSNFLSIPIPVAIGDVSRIHLANGLCLFSGLMLGPVGGGLAAGIGSSLYDLINPIYITSAPFTLVFKLILALVPGLFMKYGKDKFRWNLTGCILGQIAYIILYLGKSYVTGLLEGNAPGALVPVMLTKLGTSCINAVIAVSIAVVIYAAAKQALKKSRFSFN